jgi:hypothetical protein
VLLLFFKISNLSHLSPLFDFLTNMLQSSSTVQLHFLEIEGIKTLKQIILTHSCQEIFSSFLPKWASMITNQNLYIHLHRFLFLDYNLWLNCSDNIRFFIFIKWKEFATEHFDLFLSHYSLQSLLSTISLELQKSSDVLPLLQIILFIFHLQLNRIYLLS